MTPAQLDRIPDNLLTPDSATTARELIAHLADRGWRMTLWELETERTRRGITRRPRGGTR